MPLFAPPLSLPTTSARAHFKSHLPSRKRKRATPSSDEYDDEDLPRDLPDASTNPLSLTPDEIAQYRLAGLELDKEIPRVAKWPHRGVSGQKEWFVEERELDRKGKGKSSDVENEAINSNTAEKTGVVKGPKLRMQHLGVLTAILQKCLLEGDIPRASRAWAMLLRAQIGGTGIDIRQTGYWGIGAELLIRSSEMEARNKFQVDVASDSEADEDDLERRLEDEHREEEYWGTREGLERAKAYFERLILQYPYKRQFHGSVTALDFWPAMVACEIYGIQSEQNKDLEKIAKAEERDDDDEAADSDSDNFEDIEGYEEEDGGFAADQRRRDKRSRRRAVKRWIQKDESRIFTLNAADTLGVRMDELMNIPPYSDSHVLLRLRGMLSLYIGDLSVPAMPLEETEEENDAEQRFLYRQRVSDHERGKLLRDKEQANARKLFSKIANNGGDTSDLGDLFLGSDQDEMEVNYDE